MGIRYYCLLNLNDRNNYIMNYLVLQYGSFFYYYKYNYLNEIKVNFYIKYV